MSLFKKNKKNKTELESKELESNEINNKDIKEKLADTALSLLKKGTDYTDLLHTKVEFGYLFIVKERGIEAIFKVTTDLGDSYFAAQKGKLLRLNISEEQFKGYTEAFLETRR